MNGKKDRFSLLSLAAFALGLLLGVLVPGMFPPIAFVGEVYVSLLKLIVIPLLMAEVSVSVYRAAGDFAPRILKTIGLFIVMFVVSFLLTAALVALLAPGRGLSLFGEDWSGELAPLTLSGFFAGVFPSNLFASMASGAILPCILFAFAFGIAAHAVKAERAMGVMEDLRNICTKILGYILWLTPAGVFALMGNAAAQYGGALLGVCAKYILTAWLGCAVITVLVMMLPVWIAVGVNPWQYVKKVARVWLMTLSTCSSAATLPTTVRVCHEEFGVPDEITGIVVPLGCTIHMCGGAVSFCLLGLFSLQMAGQSVTLGMFLYMLLLATLINMAAPGIPGGGIVIGATYLTTLGIPTGFIGMYSGIYRVLDMAYTTVNVTGDITANVLLARKKTK